MKLYIARWSDLGLVASQKNLEKFHRFWCLSSYGNRLSFVNYGLGLNSAIEIWRILSENQGVWRLVKLIIKI